MQIERIEPRWNHGLGNSPQIVVYLKDELPLWDAWIYKQIPDKVGGFLLLSTNLWPWVKFQKQQKGDPRPPMGGGLSGRFILDTGETIETRGGWSSRAGVINKDYSEYLQDEISEVTIRTPYWGNMGMGGIYVSAQYLKTHAAFPNYCYLVRHLEFDDNEPYWTISKHPDAIVKGRPE